MRMTRWTTQLFKSAALPYHFTLTLKSFVRFLLSTITFKPISKFLFRQNTSPPFSF